MIRTIVSYNLNGIRSALNKGLAEWLKSYSPEVFCVQELKADKAQVDIPLFEYLGYHCFIHSAEKKGYSGVALFSKIQPDHVEIGMDNQRYDAEGRVIRADFSDFSVLNTYIPSGTTGGVRQDFKMEFLADFRKYILELRKWRKKLIICGDYNICHKPIDINHPERHQQSSGFLPEERAWFDDYVADGMVDTFRMFHNEGERYSWWSFRAGARQKNLGWRIDYHMATPEAASIVKDADILSSVQHSDHCPVIVKVEL